MDNSKQTAEGQALAFQCGLAVGKKRGESVGFWKGLATSLLAVAVGTAIVTLMTDDE